MKGPRADILSFSVLLILVGSVGTAGLIPLSFFGLDTVSVSNTGVNITPTNSVSYETTLTNNWNTSIDVEVWAQVKTSTGVIIAGPTLSATSLRSLESQTISGPIGFLTPSQNGYTLELYVWSASEPLAQVTTFDFRLTPEINIVISPSNIGGITSPITGTYPISQGSYFQISAIATSPHVFDYWEYTFDNGQHLTAQNNPFSLDTTQGMTIQAFFKDTSIPFETLTLRTEGSGSTNPAPGTYANVYRQGDDAIITAIPNVGQALDHWSIVREVGGDYTENTNSIVVSIDGFTTVTAHYTTVLTNQFDVTIHAFPLNGGSSSLGLGTTSIDQGTELKIFANANPGYTFLEWRITGETWSTSDPIAVTVDKEIDITVYFEGGNWFSVDLDAVRMIDGDVELILLEGESKNLLSGQVVYLEDSRVKIIATPHSEYDFVQWTLGPGEEQVERSREVILIVDQNWEATATFNFITEDDGRTTIPSMSSIIFPILLVIGVLGSISSFYVPGGRRITGRGL